MAETFHSGTITVGLVVLGSVLALGTSFALEWWRTRRADRRKVLLLKRFLKHEIPLIIKLNNGVISTLETHRRFTRTGVQSINRSRQGFDRNREWVTLIEDKDKELRQEIFEYFSIVDVLCYLLEELTELTSEVDTPEEAIQSYIMMSRPFIEAGESLLERLDKL